ncbi:glycerophosphodiester phosphodiesterase family protein [Oceanicaulis sp. LC35]|uniref:glycerophosphodiester phosphodiesterase family protein n=1 Tax=Oceanicaulis sp. LC35 TaxID=3349635 RepID=UPI003F879F86
MNRLTVLLFAPFLAVACSPAETPSERVEAEVSAPHWRTLDGQPTQVIAHRGASGLRPEHSQAAYQLALDLGADVIEPDLVMSSDGVLIVRHDPFLSHSTDIANRPEFADRRVEMMGQEDWWIPTFTAAELTTLTARQSMDDRDQSYNGQFPVLTFDQFLDFVAAEEDRCECVIAIEPEVKYPAELTAMGLDPLPALIASLEAHDLNRADAPVMIQSFDADFLERLNAVSDVPLAMLYAGPEAEGANAGGRSLEEIAQFADGIGAYKTLIFTPEGESTGFVAQAHALGLGVHVWTVRDDREPVVGESVQDELRALYAEGVDGVFADFPGTAVAARDQMAAE